jgi:hypothetical protein
MNDNIEGVHRGTGDEQQVARSKSSYWLVNFDHKSGYLLLIDN